MTGSHIYGKAEFQNPGGSVKDRAALGLIQDAEEKGLYDFCDQFIQRISEEYYYRLKPDGTVVEGTAGNTGIGLAHVCRAKGYKCVIYMPDSQVRCMLLNFLRGDSSYCLESREN